LTLHKYALRLLLLLVLYSLVILFVFPLFYRTNLLKPLHVLLEGVKQAQAGNLKVVLPARYEDEIGILTRTFNSMINTIRLAQNELQTINEELEERVRQRTAELAESEARYRHLATIDPLTGLFNRRHFFEFAGQEIERSLRYHRAVSAIMFDIDHFKKVNDTYGHAAGDVVLKEVAKHCQDKLREVDIIGRYGGEEFVVLLPEATLETARQVAERLRAEVASLSVSAPDVEKPILVTISLGVAELGGEFLTVDKLLANADYALYQSKQTGRNRVTTFAS